MRLVFDDSSAHYLYTVLQVAADAVKRREIQTATELGAAFYMINRHLERIYSEVGFALLEDVEVSEAQFVFLQEEVQRSLSADCNISELIKSVRIERESKELEELQESNAEKAETKKARGKAKTARVLS